MPWPPPSAEHPHQHGFTLVELMVGLLIGLLASLAVTQVLVTSEGQKRTTAAGAESLVNGALALGALQRALMSAGYGFAAAAPLIGCPLRAFFDGTAVPGLPAVLAPVVITQGGGANPADSLRVLASGKPSYAVPLPVVAPYNPGDSAFQASTVLGVAEGDLLVAATDAGADCELFRVTGTPAGNSVPRADAPGAWNPFGFPSRSYGIGSQLVNLGPLPQDQTYEVVNASLRVTRLAITSGGAPSYSPARVELFPDVVNLQALYGKDTDSDGAVDAWDTLTPTTNAQWRQVIALRLAVAARSARIEAEAVTGANPQWNVGTAIAIAGTSACGSSQCLPLAVDHLPDWQRYRYRVFDTTVPLRNMIWSP